MHSPLVGTGGMRSKVMTAKKVGAYGVPMAIINGKQPGVIKALFQGREIGTLFLPRPDRQHSRKHWIAYTVSATGQAGRRRRRTGSDREQGEEPSSRRHRQSGGRVPGRGVRDLCGPFRQALCPGPGQIFFEDLDRIKGLKTSRSPPCSATRIMMR